MLRDVVPDHEKCVREARGRAVVEMEAAEAAVAAKDKAAAKQAKKEKMRQEAALRRERLAAKSRKEAPEEPVGETPTENKQREERSSGDSNGSREGELPSPARKSEARNGGEVAVH